MNKNFFLTIAFAASITLLTAQSGLTPAAKANALTEKITQITSLNTTQKQQLSVVLNEFFGEYANVLLLKQSNPQAYSAKSTTLREQCEKGLYQILDKEQMIKYQAFRKKEISEGRTPFAEFAD